MFQDRRELWLFLGSSALGLWLALSMPVFAQESYYWAYSQHPDLSYFDHPPMVAWFIWLGGQVFGDGAIGIRALTWLSGCAVVWVGHRLLMDFGATARARRAWLVLACCVPTVAAAHFLANPDPPLACFWMLTLLALWRARSGHLGWWALAGLMAGGALLSKYTAVFLAAGGVLVLLFDPAMRRQWLRPGPWLGVGVAAVTFVPVVWWNVANDFESFRFQTSGRWDKASFGVTWFGEFVGGQLLVLGPVVALVLPTVLWWLWRRGRQADVRATWLLAFGAPLLVFLCGSSLFVQVKMNWLMPAALALLLGTALWWGESGVDLRHPQWARRLRALALAPLLLMPLAPAIELVPQRAGTSWTGWDEIAASAAHWEAVIDEPDGVEGNVFFFATNYRDSAQLARHLKLYCAVAEPDEVVEPTLAQNVVGEQALQFDHWSPPQARIGQDAIFVLPRPEQRHRFVDLVAARFRSVERVDSVHVRRLGIEVMTADVFVCREYRGPRAG
ncbi:MAG: ArnT family glycosyltransferase [Planctomycetota bacterium]